MLITPNNSSDGTSRRRFMKTVGGAGAGLALAGGMPAHLVAATAEPDPWRQAQAIIDRCAQPLAFRQEDFVITAFGARACEVTLVEAWVSFTDKARIHTPAPGAPDCYPGIAAIAACHKAGGGRVLIPAGNWYCAGPIVLQSNVHVHLAAGAQIYFSANPAH